MIEAVHEACAQLPRRRDEKAVNLAGCAAVTRLEECKMGG